MEIAESMGIVDDDVDLHSVGAYSLLTALSASQAEAFADRYLGPVRDYDLRHGSELEATLATYMGTGGGITTTADKLHIHVSTLKYRLKRIGDLTGMSLSDPEHYVCFALSCRIAHLRAVTRF
ncbi:hypothetical protein GCM10009672_26310 [Nesterenkonia lutea]